MISFSLVCLFVFYVSSLSVSLYTRFPTPFFFPPPSLCLFILFLFSQLDMQYSCSYYLWQTEYTDSMNPPHGDHFSSFLLCSLMLHIDLFFLTIFFLLCFPLPCFCSQRLDVVSHIKQVIYLQYVLTHLEKVMEKVSNDTDLLFASTDSIPPARPCPYVQQAWILFCCYKGFYSYGRSLHQIFKPGCGIYCRDLFLGPTERISIVSHIHASHHCSSLIFYKVVSFYA